MSDRISCSRLGVHATGLVKGVHATGLVKGGHATGLVKLAES